MDEITLSEEETAWEDHLRKLRGFHATDQNTKTEHSEALDDAWNAAAKDYIAAVFPTSERRTWNDLTMSTNTTVNTYADYTEVLQGDVFRVLVFNLGYLGCEHTKLVDDMKALIVAAISHDDTKKCSLVIGPTVAN